MKIRILLFLISFNLFSQNTDCPGYVFDKQLDEYKFTGQCTEGDLPVWGVANYDNGASFQGFFNSEGSISKGILTLTSGAYIIGEFNISGEFLGSKYSAVGRFVFSDGGYAESYFDDNLLTVGFGHGIATTLLQLTKGYSIISNGGFDVSPTLIKKKNYEKTKRIISEEVSKKINPILRKIVSTEDGTAGFANVKGYDIGGKTGTADIASAGGYSKKKINTFASVFPTSNPKFVLVVMLDEPKANKEFVYHYRDGRNPYKGNWRNTAGWTTVWITGQIIEKIGPILATKY